MTITTPVEQLGNNGFLGYALEPSFGAATAATDYVPFKSETLESDPGVKNVPTIRQTRSEYTAKYLGEYKVAGDIVVPFYVDSGLLFLACLFGKDTFATGAHTLETVEGGLPSLTLEKNLAGIGSLQYQGMIVSKAAIKLSTSAEAEATYSFMGQEDQSITATTPSFGADATPYSLLNIALKMGGAAMPFATAIDLTIDNGGKEFYSFQGTRYPSLVYGGSRKVEGKVTIAMQDLVYYNQALSGDFMSMEIDMAQGSNYAKFVMPNVVFGKPSQPLKMGEIITQEIPFQVYDLPGSYDIQALVKNTSIASYLP